MEASCSNTEISISHRDSAPYRESNDSLYCDFSMMETAQISNRRFHCTLRQL